MNRFINIYPGQYLRIWATPSDMRSLIADWMSRKAKGAGCRLLLGWDEWEKMPYVDMDNSAYASHIMNCGWIHRINTITI